MAAPRPRRQDGIVFDLDGTLWDTCDACAVGWNRVLARHGIAFRPIHGDDVRRVTGLPHEECVRETFAGLPEDQIAVLIRETAAEDLRVVEERGGELYPGVAHGLRALARSYPLFIVSNCQAGYIETFLRLTGLGDVFTDAECWGNTGLPKTDNLRALIARHGLRAPVMVGDAPGDQDAASACGIPFVFVRYGFASCPAPDFAVDTFPELTALLGGA